MAATAGDSIIIRKVASDLGVTLCNYAAPDKTDNYTYSLDALINTTRARSA